LITDLRNELKSEKVTLTIPGFGSQRSVIEAFIAKENIPGISFYDLMSREQLMELLRQHDCYCSNSASDSSPVSLLEAMAVGLVPIVKDHPGVRSWMPLDAGLLIGRDCSTFAEAVGVCMTGRFDVNAIRVNNQERVKKFAIWEENVATTLRVFEQVIASR
jgi:glycosyltransferase involved in cell wall biosynthesis